MRVLWFPGNGANYANTNKYNGGGWTSALANALKAQPRLELGMAIPWQKYFKEEQDGVMFYGIPKIKYGIVGYDRKLNRQVRIMKSIVDDFQPDIIHVFGSEHTGGMVATVTDKPVVLHIQGILNYCREAWLPYNLSWDKFIRWHPKVWFAKKGIDRACNTELKILYACSYYMGRTSMDRHVVSILSPDSQYFYCSEMLRPSIYNSSRIWYPHTQRQTKKIISIISPPLYKGGDVILRAAKILKSYSDIKFVWCVYGVNDMSDWENLTDISHNQVDVEIGGVVTAEQLIDVIMDADVFVHPSYIENSPNTVCEAQLLGIPVIANYVGGIPSLIESGVTGILLPPNDVYQTALAIIDLCKDADRAVALSKNAREAALKRHNPANIVSEVLKTYNTILEND